MTSELLQHFFIHLSSYLFIIVFEENVDLHKDDDNFFLEPNFIFLIFQLLSQLQAQHSAYVKTHCSSQKRRFDAFQLR